MNLDLIKLCSQYGDIATLWGYYKVLREEKEPTLERQILRRHVEREMPRAIANGRELGLIAVHGSHGGKGVPTLSQLGVNTKEMRGAWDLDPTRMGDEEFDLALDLAIRDRNVSRANVIRMAGRPVPSDTGDRHELMRGKRRVNPERVITQSIDTLRGVAAGLDLLLPEDYDQLDPLLIAEWSRELGEAKRAINKLSKELSSRG